MIYAIFVGLIVGAIFKCLHRNSGGWIVNAILGITGAIMAHFISSKNILMFDLDFPSLISAITGAVLVLFIYGYLLRKTTQLN
ncbi:MAG TPA: GlsB/YeaQ/YmgE family stress response membrane protein [Bdellovibrio sp.]|uniref:GlsB/YeaQ/YmgE family stress response membrane protein n=1 Tax=Bdellovibrio sp. TaxID=28201 RepID=UPI002F08A4A8